MGGSFFSRVMALAIPATAPTVRPSGDDDFLPSPRQLFIVLGIYFALQVVLRTFISSSVDLDEAEQVVLGQVWSWGYTSDPPLYQWLQIPFFEIFGLTTTSLSLLKNLILLFTYYFTYEAARRMTRSRLCGVAAAIALMFMPSVIWSSQRDLTHSVLAAAVSAATLLVFVRVHETRALRWYLMLGLCGGLGLLSKYNYAFWFVGLLVGAATVPETRATVLNRRIFLSLFVAVLVFLPNGMWMLNHPDLALLTSSKLKAGQAGAAWEKVPKGLWMLVRALVSFILPTAVVYWMLFVRRFRSDFRKYPGGEYVMVIARAWLLIVGILVLIVLFTGASGFKERWFQPIFISLPVISVVFLRNELKANRVRQAWGIGIGLMVLALVALAGRVLFAERLGREEPLDRPYAELARKLAEKIKPGMIIVTDTPVLAGNLRLHLPQVPATSPELFPLIAGREETVLLVWDTTGQSKAPKVLFTWLKDRGGTVRWTFASVSAPYAYSPKRTRTLSYTVASLPMDLRD